MTNEIHQSSYEGSELNNNLDSDTLFKLAQSLEKSNNYTDALNFYNQAIDQNQNNTQYLFYKGSLLIKMERYNDALKIFENLTTKNPTMAICWYTKGFILTKLSRFVGAIDAFKEANRIDPNDSDTLFKLAQSLEKSNNYTDALNFYNQAIDQNQNNTQYLFYKGSLLIKMERYNDALKIFENLTTKNPTMAICWYTKGFILTKLSRFEELEFQYQQAVKYDPNDADYWFNLGKTQYFLGKSKEGWVAINKALLLSPKDEKIINFINSITKKIQSDVTPATIRKIESTGQYSGQTVSKTQEENEESQKKIEELDRTLCNHKELIKNLQMAIAQIKVNVELKEEEIHKKQKEIETQSNEIEKREREIDRLAHTNFVNENLIEAQKKAMEIQKKESRSVQKSYSELSDLKKDLEIKEKNLEQERNKVLQDRELIERQKIDFERAKVTVESIQEKMHEKQKEIDTQLQEIDIKNQKIARDYENFEKIKQNWSKHVASTKEKDSRKMNTATVKHYETNFIERLSKNFGPRGGIVNIFKKNFEVVSITKNAENNTINISSQKDQNLDVQKQKNLPQNRYLIIKLVQKNIFSLFTNPQRYTFKALFQSRVKNYADYGCDALPLTLEDVYPIISIALREAKEEDPLILCIASPTGFDSELRDFINNKTYPHQNLLSDLVSVCLLDPVTSNIFFNPADEKAKAFLPYLQLLVDNEKRQKIKQIVFDTLDDIFYTQYKYTARYNDVLAPCLAAGLDYHVDLIKELFYEYGQEKQIEVFENDTFIIGLRLRK